MLDRAPHELHDGYGRGISYLRIAVTDKCNFRCIYCMPAEGVPPRAHDELLSAEEISHFVRLVAGEGIRRVRLTGGEPLVSHRIVPLIRELRAIPGIEDISLTTNGALLPKLAPELKKAGLDRVNISLDTLDPGQFSQITRLGRLEQTLRGIDAALAWGFDPVKVNCVVVRRLNQDVFGLAKLSVERPVHVRFIEYMPIGDEQTGTDRAHDAAQDAPTAAAFEADAPAVLEEGGPATVAGICPGGPQPDKNAAPDPHCLGGNLNASAWDASDTVPSAELRERISHAGVAAGLGGLEPVADGGPSGAGPAAYWRFSGAAGTVGFISAMSNHFCSSCNRMRLTADGSIRPCLFSDAEYPVREALRAGDDARVLAIWRDAVVHKPQEHEVIEGTERFMSQIGG